jgi:hypothetical protein
MELPHAYPASHEVHTDDPVSEYIPTAHDVHDPLVAADQDPGEHGVQLVRPVEEKYPAVHGVQVLSDVAPTAFEAVPMGHSVQEEFPPVLYVPATHLSASVGATVWSTHEYPTGHGVQDVLPVTEYSPRGHSDGRLDELVQKNPAVQDVHVPALVAPSTVEYVPTEQTLHTEFPPIAYVPAPHWIWEVQVYAPHSPTNSSIADNIT